MPAPHQEPQQAPGTIQRPRPDRPANRQGSSLLARLRAGEQVPGYRLEKGRLFKEGTEVERKEEVEFDRLKAMKHVLGNPASTDKTAGEKACRAWLEKSPGPFMDTLDKLELAARVGIPENMPGEEPIETTESDEEVKAAIRELIRKHAKGT